VDAWKGKGRGDDPSDKSVQRLAELTARTDTPRLVPLSNFKCIVFGLRPEDD